MRYSLMIILMMALSGCSLPLNSSLLPAASRTQEPTLGMTRAQVSAMMTRTVIIGYEIDPGTGEPKPLEAGSLYSTEVLTAGNETYMVDAYITGNFQAGRPVTDAVLTPMIFRNDILCGKGRDALAAIKAGSRP